MAESSAHSFTEGYVLTREEQEAAEQDHGPDVGALLKRIEGQNAEITIQKGTIASLRQTIAILRQANDRLSNEDQDEPCIEERRAIADRR
jgi:hypothetical protein